MWIASTALAVGILVVAVAMSAMSAVSSHTYAAAPNQDDGVAAVQRVRSEFQAAQRTRTADITVPEPASLILLGTGLLGLAHLRRRMP